MTAKRKGLGRGLDALIKEMPIAAPKTETPQKTRETEEILVEKISRNPFQPRHKFNIKSLSELTESVRMSGVLQPLLVRKKKNGYELIAGERRLRAAIDAGLDRVPVRVMKITDEQALEIALVENLQREDLNPIEEAKGYRSLMESFNLTQEQAAQRVGKARSTVTNALRLLRLVPEVQNMIVDGELSNGHAKILAGFEIEKEQELLAREVVRKGWSVRQLERESVRRKRPPRKSRAFRPDIPVVQLNDLKDQLQRQFGTAVSIKPSKTLANGKRIKGTIEIDYYDADELDRLLILLGIQDII
jgi:ParB family chromosome partitioning protein